MSVKHKEFRPPPERIITKTRGFLTVREVAARLGMQRESLYGRIHRGLLTAYFKKGRPSPTGWTMYVRKSEVEGLLKLPRPRNPISLNQAAKILGVKRDDVYYIVGKAGLRVFRLPYGSAANASHVWLEHAQVEAAAQARADRREGRLPKPFEALMKEQTNRAEIIRQLLKARPRGVTDVQIARAVGVSPQRVWEIKHEK